MRWAMFFLFSCGQQCFPPCSVRPGGLWKRGRSFSGVKSLVGGRAHCNAASTGGLVSWGMLHAASEIRLAER